MSDNFRLKLAIVDDHPMILEGLKSLLLQDGRYEVFLFTTGAGVLDFIQENPVDVVLLDIVLQDGSGLDFCKMIKRRCPQSAVVGISNQVERSIIFRFLENGGNGYILKNADAPEIIHCIEQAVSGELALSKEAKDIMLSTPTDVVQLPKLTRREKEILHAVAQGYTSAEIAKDLFISIITVETHRRNLLQKFKTKNMIELIKIATENKLL